VNEQDWLERVEMELLPMLRESEMVAVLAPGEEPDLKVAIELGLTILLDKPLILVIPEGRWVPERLRRAADSVVEWSDDDAEMRRRMSEVLLGQPDE
jgi:hypothetical protein